MILKLLKGLAICLVHALIGLLHPQQNPTLGHLKLLFMIPFRYMFFYYLAEAHTIESAFLRGYYDYLLALMCLGDIVIDIGAHIGTFTMPTAKHIEHVMILENHTIQLNILEHISTILTLKCLA